MKTIISDLIKITGSDQGVINLIDKSPEDNLITIAREDIKHKIDESFKVDEQLSGWVIKNKKVLIIEDILEDDRFTSIKIRNSEYKSLICCPMIIRGRNNRLNYFGKEK